MGMYFVLGSGKQRTRFARAEKHSSRWDEQKMGFRRSLGLPGHGNIIK